MNIPNMISMVRILLTPVFAVLYVRGALWQAMGVLLLCAVSDVLDGAIARRFNMVVIWFLQTFDIRFNMVTDLGKALDPAADKLIQIAMMLCAATRTKAAWLLIGLHIVRELSLAALGARVLQCTGKVYSARWYGKLCTAVIYIVMAGVLFWPDMPGALMHGGIALCAALIGLCLLLYGAKYLRLLRQSEQNNGDAGKSSSRTV